MRLWARMDQGARNDAHAIDIYLCGRVRCRVVVVVNGCKVGICLFCIYDVVVGWMRSFAVLNVVIGDGVFSRFGGDLTLTLSSWSRRVTIW